MQTDWYKLLSQECEQKLKQQIPAHTFASVYEYALLPPGKLFRPLLVINCALDQTPQLEQNKELFSDIKSLAISVECHHAYSLVHDDLPCMDDDDMRRGRLSLHKKFGQWQAVLAGDGLLNVSYSMLALIRSKQLAKLLSLFARCLGPKGLIHGQVMDLSGEMSFNARALVTTHYLKTGKLFQVCLAGAYLLSNPNPQFQDYARYLRIGKTLGILFQLIDDLDELTQSSPAMHELNINPWRIRGEELFSIVEKEAIKLQRQLRDNDIHLKAQLKPFFSHWKIMTQDTIKLKNIEYHVGGNQSLIAGIKRLAECFKFLS